MTNFRGFAFNNSPAWLRAFFGERFIGLTEGLGADLLAEGATEAIKAPWLRSDTSPNDALPSVGTERDIPKAPAETNPQYRARLLDAWRLWEQAATQPFAANALAPFGVDPGSVLLIPDYAWNPDPASTHWSRWWLVLSPPLPWTLAIWGGIPPGNWGQGAWTWGTNAPQEDIFAIIRFLCKWKSAHEIGVEVILDFGGHVWGVGTWGAPRTWGSDVVKWPLGYFWGPKYPFYSWGDVGPYNLPASYWGGKIKA